MKPRVFLAAVLLATLIGLLQMARGSATALERSSDPGSIARPVSVTPADRRTAVQLAGRASPTGAINSPQGQSQLLGNPGFENGTWSPWQTSGAPALDTNVKHGGARSAHLGNANNASDQVLQSVAIPAGASAVTLDFWYRLNTIETNAEADYFYVGLWDQSGATNYVLLWADFGQAGNVDWAREIYTLTASQLVSVTGKTALFGVVVQTNASSTSRAWVDDVALNVTTPGAVPNYKVFAPLVAKAPAGSPPVIHSFSANPASIAPGGSSTLSWSVTDATSLSISPGIGTVTGSSRVVNPSATTEYTLLATNAYGSTSAKTTVMVTSGGGDTGQFWLPYIGGNSILTTYGTSVAVDGAGGIHVGYALYSGLDNGQRPAYYAYCAANCAGLPNWSLIRLSNHVQDVRLALAPQTGHPRLMIYTWNLSTDAHEYQYAACESDCANSASWTITVITTNYEIPARRSFKNNRYFALDPQGGAGFVYTDNANNHTGTFYAHCSSACTNVGNWSESKLSDAEFDRPALTFTQDGQPRLAFGYFVYDDYYQQYVQKLYYGGCYSDCNNLPQAQWNSAVIVPVIGDGSFSLRLDANGLPRMALYPTSADLSQMQPGQLYYLWCNSAPCLNSNAWSKVSVGTPIAHGEGVDLVLDSTNRPRLAFQMGGNGLDGAGGDGLGYAWCDANCGVTSSWQARTLESSATIMALYPPGLPTHQSCPILTWLNGVRPSLALDSAGNPRLGYDAELWWGGSNPYIQCNIAVPVARFGLFNQP